MDVISLFGYRTLEPFLLSKHTPLGYRVYRYFGRRVVAPFLAAFAEGLEEPAWLIPVDDDPLDGYAHTALLARGTRLPLLRPLYGALRARNRVDYGGKSLSYRLEHPRDFRYRGPTGIQAILLDDIVTTGTTLAEANSTLKRAGVEVLFALTLAEAGR
jgi:competence protein ComFC